MTIGIIGTGWGTRAQIPAFKSVGLEVVALAARDPDKTRQQARELGIPFVTTDWRELIAHRDVRFVSIVTPPNTHREIALAALAAGKHVLCEKPMALDATETEAMVAAAEAHSGQYALIDHELRFLPAIQRARQIARRGDLGALRHVESTVLGGSRADPNRAWNWWSDRQQGGGILGAIGSHQFDTLQFVLEPIVAVNAITHTFITERPGVGGSQPVTSDDYAALLLRFGNGALGTVTLSVVAAINEPNQMTFHFEQGALRIEAGRVLIAERDGASRGGAHFSVTAAGHDFRDITPADTIPVGDQFRQGGEFQWGTVYLGHAIKQALTGDGEPLVAAATFADGHRVQRLLDAARQSSATNGGWIAIDG